MSELPVISVEGLGKRYVISHETRHDTLRDRLVHGVGGLLRRRAAKQAAQEEFWALRDVSFEVNRGEVVGVIGRNGAGKSTLLKILSRITEPTKGRVSLRGRIASLLEVGTGFHPELTGRENIFLNGAILGMSRVEIRRKFDEIVAFSEVERFLDTPVKRYSSGMYVRLAFAVAAHLEPEILIVDEVLAVGDAQFQKKCLGKIREVSRSEGRTVLFVSHHLGSVAGLCGKCVLLNQGRVEMFSDSATVITHYLGADSRQTGNADAIRTARLPGFGTKVAFTSIVYAGNAAVPFGTPLAFELEVRARAAVSGLTIAGSFFQASGECVGTFFTREKFSLPEGGSRRFRLVVSESGLAPGSYHAGFSVGTGDAGGGRRDEDVVVGLPQFQVSPAGDADSACAHWSSTWGPIHFSKASASVIDTA